MRLLLVLLALVSPLSVLAADVYVGTLASPSGSVNNNTTAVPFGLLSPRSYAIQCDAPAYVVAGPVASAETGVLIQAGQLYDVALRAPGVHLSILPMSAAASCKVFRAS